MQQATGAGGAAVSITIAATTNGTKRVIDGVHWSYSAAPTGGRLTIASGAQATYDLDIAAAGPGYVNFPGGFKGLPATSLVVTLAAPGGAVVGKINIPNDWQE